METSAITAARAPRWAAAFFCSLFLVTPCGASPLATDAFSPPANTVHIAVAENESVTASDAEASIGFLTTDTGLDSTYSVPSDASGWSVRGEAREVRPLRGSLLRGDFLPATLESLLDPGVLVWQKEKGYPALPGMSGTPAVVAVVPVLSRSAGGQLQESTWRETGFNVMRWTSAALAVLAVAGTVVVLVMPGLRRRLFFPDMPQLPPSPA